MLFAPGMGMWPPDLMANWHWFATSVLTACDTSWADLGLTTQPGFSTAVLDHRFSMRVRYGTDCAVLAVDTFCATPVAFSNRLAVVCTTMAPASSKMPSSELHFWQGGGEEQTLSTCN